MGTVGEGVCLVDASGQVIFRDEGFANAVGLPIAVGDFIGVILPWVELRDGTFEHEDAPLRVHVSLTPSVDSVAATLVAHEWSEFRSAQASLRIAEQTLRSLIDACPVSILTLDPAMNITLWNPAAEHMFGWSQSDVLGKPYPLVPPSELESFRRLFDRVMAGEGFVGVEGVRHRKDGSPVELRIATAPLRGADGNVAGAMALLEDLSESKRLEERIRHGQKMEAVGRLAGGVAHDFNNLLMVILATCDLLTFDGELSAEVEEGIDAIQQCGQRAHKLTSQLLAFSRRQVLRPVRADVSDLVRESAALLHRVVGEHITLSLELTDEATQVIVDTNQFDQMLMNLAMNATDAMPDGGALTICTRSEEHPGDSLVEAGRYAHIEIRDTGSGIDALVLPHIFEPFFTTKTDGTGLGLATVYGIAQQSGGSIEVESSTAGTCFRIVLPLIAAEPIAPTVAPPDEAPRGSGRVLVVEDEPSVREVVMMMLESLGYEPVAAADGVEAIAILNASEPFAVVLSDLAMPRMNGRELALKLSVHRPELPVVLMSAHLDIPDLRGRVEKGKLRFLQKPLRRNTLAKEIRASLSPTPTPPIVD